MIDFYALLGVQSNETNQEIKKAYRKLALKYHPDRHQGDSHEAEEMMKLLNEAKDVLLNDEKREEYDAALYSFQQFKARQQQEAERRQREQAEQAARKKRQQAEQAEREQQAEAARQRQAHAEREQREQAQREQQAQRERQQQAQREQQRQDAKRKREQDEAQRRRNDKAWQEYLQRQREEAERKAAQAEYFRQKLKEERLREEEDQRRAKEERLAREAEEQHRQEYLARTLKKRNRILLIGILAVLGGIFYFNQSHLSEPEYEEDLEVVYGMLEDDPPENSVENDVMHEIGEDDSTWLNDEELTHHDHQTEIQQEASGNSQQREMTEAGTTETSAAVEKQVKQSERPSVQVAEPEAVKTKPAPPKPKDEGLSMTNDDFFN